MNLRTASSRVRTVPVSFTVRGMTLKAVPASIMVTESRASRIGSTLRDTIGEREGENTTHIIQSSIVMGVVIASSHLLSDPSQSVPIRSWVLAWVAKGVET